MKNNFFYVKKSNIKIAFNAVMNGLITLVMIAFLLVIGFYVTHNSTPVRIVGDSMQPGIYEGQYAFTTTPNYTYGNIIIVNRPDKDVIKRVIALEGDKVGYYFDGQYYRTLVVKNGTPELIDEWYLTQGVTNKNEIEILLSNNEISYNHFNNTILTYTTEQIEFKGQSITVLPLTENQVFILGDNRGVSYDSASYGPITENTISARVDLVVNKDDIYFFEILKYMTGF